MSDKHASRGPHGESWLWVVKHILLGSRDRPIGERFFGIASLFVFMTTLFNATSLKFPETLIFVVPAEMAIALVAILLIKLEGRKSSEQQSRGPTKSVSGNVLIYPPTHRKSDEHKSGMTVDETRAADLGSGKVRNLP
jgi:hypothetical protein